MRFAKAFDKMKEGHRFIVTGIRYCVKNGMLFFYDEGRERWVREVIDSVFVDLLKSRWVLIDD